MRSHHVIKLGFDTIREMSQMLKNFLDKHRIQKGSSNYTHTGIGNQMGSYRIVGSDEVKTLHKLIGESKNSVSLTERHGDGHSIICIDFDFRFETQPSERCINADLLSAIVSLYNKNLLDLGVPKDHLEAVVFARENGYPDKNYYKDGFHVMYVQFQLDYDSQYELRKRVIADLERVDILPETTNDITSIVDKAVIQSNSWTLFGCSKPYKDPYKIVAIYDAECNEQSIPERDWINYLSLHLNYDLAPMIQTNFHSELVPTTRVPAVIVKRSLPVNSSLNNTMIPEINTLLDMLNPARADNYENWSKVGMSLACTDSGLIEVFRKWSKKSSKYDESQFDAQWNGFCSTKKITLGSLKFWARQDSPEKYAVYLKKGLDSLLMKSLSNTCIDVANVVVKSIGDSHVFSGKGEKPDWYWFNGVRWVADHGALSVRRDISTQVLGHYTSIISSIDEKFLTGFYDLTYKLRDVTFIKKVITALEPLLIDYEFKNKLDADPSLLGFNDGVYDLRLNEWRKSFPCDHVSLSVGKNYHDIEKLETTEVEEFIRTVLPIETEREYAVDLFATCLNGYAIEQFNVFSGCGGNGKSRLMGVMISAMGDYGTNAKVDILLNDKAFSANGASEDIHILKGKRFVTVSEPDPGKLIRTSNVKILLGGSSEKIVSRGNYQSATTWVPQFKLFMSCNTIPYLDYQDIGSARRGNLLPFTARFVYPDQYEKLKRCENVFLIDPQLDEKVAAYSDQLLVLLLRRYGKLKDVKRVKPTPTVTAATNEWVNRSNMFVSFLCDNLTESKENTLTFKELYGYFTDSEFYRNQLSKRDKRGMTRKECFAMFKRSHFYSSYCDPDHPDENMRKASKFGQDHSQFLVGYVMSSQL